MNMMRKSDTFAERKSRKRSARVCFVLREYKNVLRGFTNIFYGDMTINIHIIFFVKIESGKWKRGDKY